jgi:superfamily II DNA/RNA helicase
MLPRKKHTGKRSYVVMDNKPTEYQGMLDKLDALIQRNRFQDTKSTPEATNKRKKQKIVHSGQVFQISTTQGPLIATVEALNSDLRVAVGKTLEQVHLTSLQHQILPHAIAGKDFIVSTTSNDRVLSYVLPCFHNMIRSSFKPQFGTGVIIIVPSREMAKHVHKICIKLLSNLQIGDEKPTFTLGCMSGTTSTNVLITTPLRLLMNLKQNTIKHTNLRAVIIDGCDDIIEIGQQDMLENTMSQLSSKRQTMLYTYSINEHVNEFSKSIMKANPIIFEQKLQYKKPSVIHEKIVVYPLEFKIMYLFAVLKHSADKAHKKNHNKKAIIFCNSTEEAEYYFKLFDAISNHCPNMKFFFVSFQLVCINNDRVKKTMKKC